MNTKVICTLGPASDSPEMIRSLIKTGMNVARFNCSHGTVEEQRAKIKRVKDARKALGTKTILCLDTKGPDVRLGDFKEAVQIKEGQTFKFYFGDKYKDKIGDEHGVYVPYTKFYSIVKVGAQLCLNDGTLVMIVKEMKDNVITAEVKQGGTLKTRKALAAPGYDLQLPFISEEDVADFKMGIEEGVDWIAASCVSRTKDVTELREFLKKNGGSKIKIISKIEDRFGVKDLDGIVAASDGVMVARGGLGTDIPMDTLPAVQKLIVEKTRAAGKIAIVATMMMESMINNPSPTRAEISDIANAVWDGANCVMLSAETAAGKWPLKAVEYMVKAATDAEKHKEYMRVK